MSDFDEMIISRWNAVSNGDPIWVWPDGCRDLLLTQEPGKSLRLSLTGIDANAYRVCTPEGTRFWGFRFKPGVRGRWEAAIRTERTPMSTDFIRAFCDSSELKTVLNEPDAFLERIVDGIDCWFKPPESPSFTLSPFLKDSGNSVYLSERSFRRHCNQYTGKSPKFWKSLHRARRGADALLLTDSPISDIAVDLGFSDQAHFSREMVKFFGHPPLQLRKGAPLWRNRLLAPSAFDAST